MCVCGDIETTGTAKFGQDLLYTLVLGYMRVVYVCACGCVVTGEGESDLQVLCSVAR